MVESDNARVTGALRQWTLMPGALQATIDCVAGLVTPLALIRAGLGWCGQLGLDVAAVLWRIGYNRRFGFPPSLCIGIICECSRDE